eukprot:6202186-Pleurochrysis_carterae.AAC.4
MPLQQDYAIPIGRWPALSSGPAPSSTRVATVRALLLELQRRKGDIRTSCWHTLLTSAGSAREKHGEPWHFLVSAFMRLQLIAEQHCKCAHGRRQGKGQWPRSVCIGRVVAAVACVLTSLRPQTDSTRTQNCRVQWAQG